MAYLVLARKYRPQTFDEIYAQDHITTILKNTIELDRIAHAYLFTGPRGVGKTSLARIFSKGLNCLKGGPTIFPCNECTNCTEITDGISADVIEIDGASNTGIDDIRELQKELLYSPSNSRYKIYIIDEVHMLSKNAFNALLKTLEEPPENVIFIFATTEPHKVIPTIISRCQRFDFKRIPIPAIVAQLSAICEIEKITIEENALFTLAKKADGSMRDALSLMDQVLSFGENNITLENILSIFGIVHTDVYNEIMNSIIDKNSTKIIELLHDILEKENDIQEFLNGLLEYIRNLMLLKIGLDVQEIPQLYKTIMRNISNKFEENDLLYLISILIKTKTDIRVSTNPILVAEMSFIKLAKLSELKSLEKILEDISSKSFEKVIAKPEEKPDLSSLKNEKILHKKTEEVKSELTKEVSEEKPHIKEITIIDIENDKEIILNKIKKEKMILANYFNNSKIESISNNFIHFIVSNSIAYNLLVDEKVFITQIISNHFNLKIRINFTLKKAKKTKTIANPTMDDIKRESPDLAEFIELTESIVS